MKKIVVSMTILVLMFSLVISNVPLDTFASDNTEWNQEINSKEAINGETTSNDESIQDVDLTVAKETDYSETVQQTEQSVETNENQAIYNLVKLKKGAFLYKSKTIRTPSVIIQNSNVFFYAEQVESDHEYFLVKWQNEKLYVHTQDILEENSSDVPSIDKSQILSLIAPKGTKIFSSMEESDLLATIEEETTVSVVDDINNYFEVQIGGVSGYIKKQVNFTAKIKSGNLLSATGQVVGKIDGREAFYSVVPTTNRNKYQITIGSNRYLVESSLLTLHTSTKKELSSSRNDMITIKANSKIYADSTLKQPIVTLNTTMKTKILNISGSNYIVQVGNLMGYVPISSTTGQFAVKLKVGSKIYKNANKTSTLVVNKNNTMVYTVSRTSNNNLFSIVIGSKTYYVNYTDIVFTTENTKTANTTRKDTIKMKSGFVLYKEANTKIPLFSNGLQNELFVNGGVYGQYYKVYVGNVVAYVPSKYVITGTNREVSANSNAMLYKYVNKKYVAIGTVLNGFTFKPTSSNSRYYLFKKGNEIFAIKKSDVLGTNKGVSLKTKATASFPVTLYTERHSAIYNSSGVKIATLYKGQAVALKGISSRNYAIIDYMGQQAEVRFTDLYHKDIVNGKTTISYSRMSYYLRLFSLMYPEFTKLEVIGKSVEGRAIYALRVGNGKKEILLDASLHAREHMTTNVLLEMIDHYSNAYYRNGNFAGYNVRSTLNSTSIWFLPMMNPDGVMLVQQGIGSLKNKNNINFVKKHARKGSYKHWKANARGVDLNRNFDAVRWNSLWSDPRGYANYKGAKPNSEPEINAFISFANKHQFKSYISYHSSGNLIYWDGLAKESYLNRTYNLLKNVGKITGYKQETFSSKMFTSNVVSNPKGQSTAWMMKYKKIPVLTIEIAPYQGEKPVSIVYWPSIWNKNKTVGLYAAKEAANK